MLLGNPEFAELQALRYGMDMKIRNFCVILSLLTLSACSQVKLVYNHASWLARQRVNSFVDFTPEQKKRVHEELDRYFAQHRKNLLPQYSSFLRKIESKLHGPVELSDVRLFHGEFLKLFHATLEPAVDPAAAILITLTPVQIDQLERNLDRFNERSRHEWLRGDHEWKLGKRADRTVDSISDWTGWLKRAQENEIKALSRKIPYLTQVWFENREKKQQGLLKLLREKSTHLQVKEYLTKWLLDARLHRAQEQAQIFNDFDAATDEFLMKTWNVLNQKQKEKTRHKLENLADDFKELSEN